MVSTAPKEDEYHTLVEKLTRLSQKIDCTDDGMKQQRWMDKKERLTCEYLYGKLEKLDDNNSREFYEFVRDFMYALFNDWIPAEQSVPFEVELEIFLEDSTHGDRTGARRKLLEFLDMCSRS